MADDDLLVTISGPALSLLLYENRRIHDQIGFLLGEIVKYVTKKVTDSDKDVEYIKEHINIKCIEPYPISKPFFNSIGKIDKEILTNFLKDNIKKVVGWFHYRQEEPIQSTMRDNILHSELSTFFSNSNKHLQTKYNFIMCLLNSSTSEIGGTHRFKHLLLRSGKTQSKLYIPVPLKINNLGADATRPDGSDYKPTPMASSCKSDTFNLIYDSVRNDLLHTSGADSVTLIQKAAENYLEKLISEVTKYDRSISELEIELNELRQMKYREQFNLHMQEQSNTRRKQFSFITESISDAEAKVKKIQLTDERKSYAAASSSAKPPPKPPKPLKPHRLDSTSNRQDSYSDPEYFYESSRLYKEANDDLKKQLSEMTRSSIIASRLTADSRYSRQSPELDDTDS